MLYWRYLIEDSEKYTGQFMDAWLLHVTLCNMASPAARPTHITAYTFHFTVLMALTVSFQNFRNALCILGGRFSGLKGKPTGCFFRGHGLTEGKEEHRKGIWVVKNRHYPKKKCQGPVTNSGKCLIAACNWKGSGLKGAEKIQSSALVIL